MKHDLHDIMVTFVDHLLPILTPSETSLYLFLLRHAVIGAGAESVRVGKRTIADGYGIGSRGVKTNYDHMTTVIKGLERRGCVSVGDTTRGGTLYTVIMPRDVPSVKEAIANLEPRFEEEDYFSSPEKRVVIFERDKWICQYCGDKVTGENATLDHFIPQSSRGTHAMDNLRTCCLVCNSVKSGKSYEDAAPLILKSIQERRQRQQQ